MRCDASPRLERQCPAAARAGHCLSLFPPANLKPFLFKVYPELGRDDHPTGNETELYPIILILS